MKCPVIYRTVAEECDRHVFGVEDFERVSSSAGLQDAGAYDAAGSHQPDPRSKQVHTATPTVRNTAFTTEEFRYQ